MKRPNVNGVIGPNSGTTICVVVLNSFILPYASCIVYLPTFGLNLPGIYKPYMVHMGLTPQSFASHPIFDIYPVSQANH